VRVAPAAAGPVRPQGITAENKDWSILSRALCLSLSLSLSLSPSLSLYLSHSLPLSHSLSLSLSLTLSSLFLSR